MAESAVATKMEVSSVKDFMVNNMLTISSDKDGVKRVRTNVNNKPYLTFIKSDGQAENIYFSQNGANLVSKGQEVIKGFFDPFTIGQFPDENGEIRSVLITGNTALQEIEDLF